MNLSANISRQVDLKEFDEDDTKKEDLLYQDHIDEETINDALNLSYQVLNYGVGGQDNPPFISRSRNKNSEPSTAEGDSQYKSWGKRVFSSIGKRLISSSDF